MKPPSKPTSDPYKLLKISRESTLHDIEEAYLRARQEHDPLATYGLIPEEELPDPEEIEAAYRFLKEEHMRQTSSSKVSKRAAPPSSPPSSKVSQEPKGGGSQASDALAPFSLRTPSNLRGGGVEGDWEKRLWDGSFLKAMRLARQLTLESISSIIKVSRTQLDALENHRYHLLPPPVYVKGFLRAYARVLHIDPEKLVRDYFSRWESAGKEGL